MYEKLIKNLDIKSKNYDIWKAISTRPLGMFEDKDLSHQIICDIDKTYLETEFESLRKIVQIPFEDPEDKITVQGANHTLKAFRWGDTNQTEDKKFFPRPLHFVSSSPPQLRKVLREKFILDGLDWTSDTFKNQIYNIKKRRFDLIKHQVAYKSAAILNIIQSQPNSASCFYLIGDSAELDAYIYLGVQLLLTDQLTAEGYSSYLRVSGVDDFNIKRILEKISLDRLKNKKAFILIRELENYPFVSHSLLTDQIFVFSNYFEVLLLFCGKELISKEHFFHLTKIFHNKYPLEASFLLEKIEIALQKNLIKKEQIQDAIEHLCSMNLFVKEHSICSTLSLKEEAAILKQDQILEEAFAWMKVIKKNQEAKKED